MELFTIYWTALSCVSHLFSIILIHVIVTEQVDKSVGLKTFLLNFAISDFWFTFTFAWAVTPEFVIPYPLIKITGFFHYLSNDLKWVVVFLFVLPTVALSYSTVELCVVRSLILFEQGSRIRLISGKTRLVFIPFFYIVTSLATVFSFHYFRSEDTTLARFGAEHNLTGLLTSLNEEKDMIIAFNSYHPKIHFYSIGACIIAFIVPTFMMIFVMILYRSSHIKNNRNFSTAMIKLQQNVTTLLVLNCFVLFCFVTIPMCAVIMVCRFYSIFSQTETVFLKYLASYVMLAHPIIIACLTLWLVDPYRLFLRMLAYSSLPKWCLPDDRSAVTPVRWQVHESQPNFNHIRRISDVNSQRMRAATAPVRATYFNYR